MGYDESSNLKDELIIADKFILFIKFFIGLSSSSLTWFFNSIYRTSKLKIYFVFS